MKKSLTKQGMNLHMTNETSSPRKVDTLKAKMNKSSTKKPKVTLTPIGANKVDER